MTHFDHIALAVFDYAVVVVIALVAVAVIAVDDDNVDNSASD